MCLVNYNKKLHFLVQVNFVISSYFTKQLYEMGRNGGHFQFRHTRKHCIQQKYVTEKNILQTCVINNVGIAFDSLVPADL